MKSAGLAASQSVHRDQAPQGEEPILGGGPVREELRQLVRGPHRGRGPFARTPARTAAFRPARRVASRRARDAGDNRRPVTAGPAPRSRASPAPAGGSGRPTGHDPGTGPDTGARARRTTDTLRGANADPRPARTRTTKRSSTRPPAADGLAPAPVTCAPTPPGAGWHSHHDADAAPSRPRAAPYI